MDHRAEMRKYQEKVDQETKKLEALAPVIAREVERQYGHKLHRAKSAQERENLRQYYTVLLGRENIWKQSYLSDRDLYIKLATMHGIVALVEQTQVVQEPF